MKKFLIKTAALVLFTGFMISCEEETTDFDATGGQTLAGFNDETGKLAVYDDGVYSYEIEVGVSTAKSFPRTINLDLNEELTTALPGEYTIDQATLTIPANEFVGLVKITGNYAALPEGDVKKLVFDLVSVEGQDVLNPEMTRFTLDIFRACERDDFPLAYDVEVYAFDEYAPSHSVTFVPVANELNTYQIVSSWGPSFVAWATGNSAYEGQYLNPGKIVINCNNTVEFVGTYSVNQPGSTYDPATGVITLVINQSLFASAFNTTLTFIPQP